VSDPERLRDAEDALREALRVEPSPALLARVRADAAGARPSRGAAWLGAAAAALVIGVAAAFVVRTPGAPAPTPASPAPPRIEQAFENEAPAPVVPSASARPLTSRAPKPPPPVAPSSAEVIVVPGQAQALARLVELVWSGEVPPPRALLEPDDALASLPLPEPVRIEPLTIAPLDPYASLAPSPLGRGDS